MGWLDRLLRDTSVEHDEHLSLKKSFFLVHICVSLALAGVTLNMISGTTSETGVIVIGCGLLLGVSALVRVAWTRRLDPAFLAVLCMAWAFFVLSMDYVTLGVVELWVLQVLVMDAVLAFGAASWASPAILALTVTYLFARSTQATYDYGFWVDMPGKTRYEPYLAPRKSSSLFASTLVASLVAFAGDFYVTRSFAFALTAQNRAMKVSQQVTEQLAVLLSRYEVDSALELLREESSAALPSALRDAFVALVDNLCTYKPYLPQSCLPTDDYAEEAEDRGTQEGSVAQSEVPSDLSSSLPERQTSTKVPGRPSYASAGSQSLSSSGHSGTASPGRLASTLAAQQGAVKAAPRIANITCVCVNRCGFLDWLSARGTDSVRRLLQVELDRFAKLVVHHRGITDTLCGDHFSACFNAARACATHGPSAAKCAFSFTQQVEGPEQLTCALCSGRSLCGDFGSAAIVRFMLIGREHNLLTVLERAAACWRIGVLTTDQTHADLTDTWQCRLHSAATFHKRGAGRRMLLWEILRERRGEEGVGCSEWMYELEAMGDDPWSLYNIMMRLWLGGEPGRARARAAGADPGHPAVASALSRMIDDIDAGRPPPLHMLSEAAVWPAESAPSAPQQDAGGEGVLMTCTAEVLPLHEDPANVPVCT
eukprot:TRINITY_DN14011_c0_g1_i1.p1 TRINITY_DN14011_c0_g1~~TRINITY_DN14011_c0_g1_i1.p1  ORF type:complete len:688 (+),score=138.57 TRINITY_DN14011_c0_g1_i1:107-2065(+)